MSRLKIALQKPARVKQYPGRRELCRWVEAALASKLGGGHKVRCSLVVRIVDEEEGATLNRRYRGGTGPTNVLSFPWEAPAGLQSRHRRHLGDLVICAPLLRREAHLQGKSVRAHWAHLVVHGVLHLLGMDHQDEVGAVAMEDWERRILSGLGFPDPYADPRGTEV